MFYILSAKNIILTINLMLVFVVLIIVFYRIIKKEYKSYKRKKALSINDIVRFKVFKKFLKYQINVNKDIKDFTLLLVSIDHFETIKKYVNKEEEGDYLRKVAANLRMHLPLNGKMSQFTDRTSFIIYLPRVYEEDLLNQLIKKFKNAAEQRINLTGEVYIQKSMSVGYTTYPHDSDDLDTLINNLKLTILNIKRQNGNLILGYNQGVKEIYPERFALLKTAIRNEEINLYYNPIYDIINKEVYGTEIILNWNNKNSELKTLLDLLLYAEASNDNYWIGLWVFDKMIEAHVNLLKAMETKEYYVMMQISIKQFDNDNIIENIERITRKYQVDARRVVFQIVDPIEANSSIKLMKNIIELQRLGYKFSLEVGNIDNKLKVLINEYRINFIKISKNAINTDKSNIVDLRNFAKDSNIDIIITDIVNEDESMNFKDNATYLQGGLEGFPCVKEDLLSLVTKYRRSL